MSEGFFCANGGNQSWQVWISLRGKTKMAESKMAKFKMAAIIKLSENEWVWVQIELVWVRFRSWQVWVFESESGRWYQGVWIQDGRIQDGCHHQVEWEWMSLKFYLCKWWESESWVKWESVFEWIWEKIPKMFESKMAEFKMAAIIKLSENEWVRVFFANGGKQSWQVWVSLRGKN